MTLRVLKSIRISTMTVFGGLCLLSGCATESRFDKDQGYPDYNRLEIRPKRKEPEKAPVPTPPAPPVPMSHPSLNSPVNLPSGLDDAPAPPPAIVPLKGGSEPELPEDMLTTLVPGSTIQK